MFEQCLQWFDMLANRFRFVWRRVRNDPLDYHFIEGSDGESVGEPLRVIYPSFHDMCEFACRWRLTWEQLWMGRYAGVNALRIVSITVDHKVATGSALIQPARYGA